MLYRSLVEAYSRIEGVRSRTQVANELAELFARTPARVVGRLVYLIQGKLRPDWEGVEIGLGEKLAVRALAAAARASEPAVSRQLRRLGDVGDAAQEVMRDHSAVPPPLSLEEVYGALERIALSRYRRRLVERNGAVTEYPLVPYSLRLWRQLQGIEVPLPPTFVDSRSMAPEAQLEMLASLQQFVDGAIAKTINLPADCPLETVRPLFQLADEKGLKGCTLFPSKAPLGAVLSR